MRKATWVLGGKEAIRRAKSLLSVVELPLIDNRTSLTCKPAAAAGPSLMISVMSDPFASPNPMRAAVSESTSCILTPSQPRFSDPEGVNSGCGVETACRYTFPAMPLPLRRSNFEQRRGGAVQVFHEC